MLSTSGMVFDVRRFSVEDGPGIRTTVFFKGCPLRCAWCHNPESQSPRHELMVRTDRCIRCGACAVACPQGVDAHGRLPDGGAGCLLCGACVEACCAEARALVGRSATVRELMAGVVRDIPFYDRSGGGVTFSGGEPLAQPAFLSALLAACREQEIATALDTCGYAAWETLDRMRGLVDLFLFDLKLMDDTRHREFTGVSNQLILDNLRRLAGCGHEVLVRIPIIPGITDCQDNLAAIGAFVSALPGVEEIHVLPYHRSALGKYERLRRDYKLPELMTPSEERMYEIAGALRGFGLRVKVGG